MLLTNITIPTPQPYDAKDPSRQQENYFYVLNQIITQAKAQGLTWESLHSSGSMSIPDLAEVVAALQDIAHRETWQDFGHFRQSITSRISESL